MNDLYVIKDNITYLCTNLALAKKIISIRDRVCKKNARFLQATPQISDLAPQSQIDFIYIFKFLIEIQVCLQSAKMLSSSRSRFKKIRFMLVGISSRPKQNAANFILKSTN